MANKKQNEDNADIIDRLRNAMPAYTHFEYTDEEAERYIMNIIEKVEKEKASKFKKSAGILGGLGLAGIAGVLSISLLSAPTVSVINLSGDTGASNKVSGNLESSDAMIGMPWFSYEYMAGESLSKDVPSGAVYRIAKGQDARELIESLSKVFKVEGSILENGGYPVGNNDYINLSYGVIIDVDSSTVLEGSSGEAVQSDSTDESKKSPENQSTESYKSIDWTNPNISVWQNKEGNPSWYYSSGKYTSFNSTSKEKAEAQASILLSSLGFENKDFKITTNKNEYSTLVSANLMVENEVTAISFSFEFQGEGELSYASGQSFRIIKLGDTALISAFDAAEGRANDYRYYGWAYTDYNYGIGVMAKDSATSSIGSVSANTPDEPVEQVTVDSENSSESIEPMPIEEYAPETKKVTLVTSELVWMIVYDTSGVGYLVKGYTLKGQDNVSVNVIAVPDEMVNLPK